MNKIYLCSVFVYLVLGVTLSLANDDSEISNVTIVNIFDNQRQENVETIFLNESRKIQFDTFTNEVFLKFYRNGLLTHIADVTGSEALSQVGCSANEKFSFLFHGWREGCNTEWMTLLIAKLTKHRGGCIVCVDYETISDASYVTLARNSEFMAATVATKLQFYQLQGLDPQNVYMFGFSLGGRIATIVGRLFGPGLIKNIDVCDMAGPLFDIKPIYKDQRNAAENVQCIHTSRDKGTRNYNCHQNWRMGNCGVTQAAAGEPPRGSHGMCPYFYISAFENDFFAIKQPRRCLSGNPALSWPQNFKMGYMETRKSDVLGELFADTGPVYPYNVVPGNYYGIAQQVSANAISQSPEHPRRRKKRPILNSINRVRRLLFHKHHSE